MTANPAQRNVGAKKSNPATANISKLRLMAAQVSAARA